MFAIALSACLQAAAPPGEACNSCHGGERTSAPPRALGGAVDARLRGVGAHEVHVLLANSAPVVPCTECHDVPATVDAPGHIDTPWPAEVTWANGVLAGIGAEPFDAIGLTCTVYCHGTTLTGGSNTTPSWIGGAPEAICGTCHGSPPPPPHPVGGGACGNCHAPAAGNAALHIDGILQVNGNTTDTGGANPCVACHGAGDNAAPPPDTRGRVDTTVFTVGAHATHVNGTANSAPVACGDCHLVPAVVEAPGHIDNAPAEVIFAGVALDGAGSPVYARPTCTEVGCHARGGTVPEPVWTQVDGTQAACGACHTNPPPLPHPDEANCGDCHPNAGPGATIIDASRHVDGRVDQ